LTKQNDVRAATFQGVADNSAAFVRERPGFYFDPPGGLSLKCQRFLLQQKKKSELALGQSTHDWPWAFLF
jgi:hypothetical protein